MRKTFVLKKVFLILPVIFLIVSLNLIFLTGCRQIGANISEKISEKATESADEESDKQTVAGLPKDFPSSVPIYPNAEIVESEENKVDGKMTYKIMLQGKGEIKKLSDWYKQSLKKEWNIGAVSEGDMGNWSEFFAEAQNESYFMTVYLYQDDGSDNVGIELNVKGLAEGETVIEITGQEAPEDKESTDAEEPSEDTEEPANDTEESTGQSSQSYSGELEGAGIALVCASVGSNWNISGHFPRLNISVYDEYQFDKGYRIQEMLGSEKPDIMIIKECAAYFPPNANGSSMPAYQDLIRDWVNLCRGQGVIPVLTTVVPIDPDNPSNSGQTQLDSILEYNDWIKQYCSEEDISVLDLEAALHISDTNRALNPAYDSGDGLHPNEIAYTEKLDNILIPALERALVIGH